MPYIDIQEIDLTTPGSVMESTDVVFIPGFVNTKQQSLYENNAYIGLEANRPYLFTDVNEFIALCGNEAPIFNTDQVYDNNFAAAAIPDATNRIFLAKGSVDPSYIMAKELLASGLPVLYQRVNTDSDTDSKTTVYEAVDSETSKALKGKTPTDADEEYFYKAGEDYLSYKDPVNYPNFTSFVSEGGDGNVHSMKLVEYADANTYYNPAEGVTYYVYEDGSVGTESDGVDVKVIDSLLMKQADGTFKLVGASLPAKDADKAEYALPVYVATQPNNWAKEYTNYYTSSSTGTYTQIAKVEESIKNYEDGNIYTSKEVITSAFSVSKMYEALDKIFNVADSEEDQDVSGLIDKGNYSVKYLTSGGYPVFEYTGLANKMLTMAETRGDCVALIDHTDFPNREINPHKDGSLYKSVLAEKDTSLAKGDFGAMFTPWATYSRITSDSNDPKTPKTFRAPGSYAYLIALADSIKTNANWLAVAGAARGGIKNLHEMNTVIPNGVADAMQPRDNIAINAITNIRPYGYTIWGNRTLKDNAEQGNLVATSFLNIRNLVSDVKKTCYRAARKLTFEQDTDVLWINFKSEISKLLDQMKSGYGISGYKILRDNTHVRAKDKATLCAKVILYPTYVVEDFYITIVLKDDEVTVE